MAFSRNGYVELATLAKSGGRQLFLIVGTYVRHDLFHYTALRECRMDGAMATLHLDGDNTNSRVWWIKWLEREEIIGRIVKEEAGRCRVYPSGPHWGPMKSFAAFSFDSPQTALAEVELYFRGR